MTKLMLPKNALPRRLTAVQGYLPSVWLPETALTKENLPNLPLLQRLGRVAVIVHDRRNITGRTASGEVRLVPGNSIEQILALNSHNYRKADGTAGTATVPSALLWRMHGEPCTTRYGETYGNPLRGSQEDQRIDALLYPTNSDLTVLDTASSGYRVDYVGPFAVQLATPATASLHVADRACISYMKGIDPFSQTN